jgi:isoleucyl-tRNA synthetase
VDGFTFEGEEVPVEQRPEIDRWIISLLHSLIKEVQEQYDNYEPTRAARLIQDFVTENLSNWYVRLNRKRYWGGEFDADKRAAYQTLYTCLETVAQLAAPVAPFYMDRLFIDLNNVTGRYEAESVHLSDFPTADETLIDAALEARMDVAQKLSSMILGLRRKVNIKVRQPLNKMMLPILDPELQDQVESVKSLVLNEVNVKDIEYITDTAGILVKKIKPNFKTLGPRFGKQMKEVSGAINALSQEDIAAFENAGSFAIKVNGEKVLLNLEDVEIVSEDIPGWLVANEGSLTVALDIHITEELRQEGMARELINRIQNIRKESGFDVTDKIEVLIEKHELINEAVENHGNYIGSQTLASSILLKDTLENQASKRIDIDEDIFINIRVTRVE